MERSEKVDLFAKAFAKAQSNIKRAAKDSQNPFYKADYADLGSVMDACKDALNSNGISVIQSPAQSEKGTLAMDTMLIHESGQWVSGQILMPLGKSDPQGYGSALTYARRYALAAMAGVCPKDDDAEGATERGKKPQDNPKPPAAPKETPLTPEEAKAFAETILLILTDRGFTKEQSATAMQYAAKVKKVKKIGAMSAANREELSVAIDAGKFDQFKNAAK
jgi:hypothetical protein